MIRFIIRFAFAAAGLWLASLLVTGVSITGWGTLVAAAAILGLLNAIIRPVVVLLTLPITLLTLGLFILVVNAAMLGLTAMFLEHMQVAGFWPAVLGSLVVSIVSWVGHALTREEDRRRR